MQFFDHHVHTNYSRCVHQPYSIDAALEVALGRGFIEAIGITNHVHFNSPEQEHLKKSRTEIDTINEVAGEPRVLLGVEVDVDHPSGRFVLSDASLAIVDYVIAGPHNLPHESLAMEGMGPEEFSEYFGSLEEILLNSLSKNPIDIWVHPFLQEIEIGGEYFAEYIFHMLPGILDVLESNRIAMEISATFPRDKGYPLKVPGANMLEEAWLQIARITSTIYKMALDHGGISFSFASDAHDLENAGDIGFSIVLSKFLAIPGEKILHVRDLQGRHQ
ncbi:MAG TPA: hypothetical protein VKM55_03635 [Candidatus Lokiarchaeia archaeon]|nr:hypothetical protein [Candidatus Lokiarchaeia archaeon]